MANFGIGLAQGFQLGTQVGEAFRKRRMREDIEEAQKEAQRPKFTFEQGAQMRRESEMKDEQGRPLYEFTIEPGSTTYNRRELRYAPEEVSGGLEMSMASDRVTPSTPEAESAAPVDLSRIFATPVYPNRASMVGQAPIPPYKLDLVGEPGGLTAGGTAYPPAYRGLPPSSAPAAPAAPEAPSVMTPGAFRGGLSPVDFTRALPSDREAIIRALTTEYGPSEAMKPGATEYLGKTYGAEGLTPAQQRSALLNRYADIISTYEGPVEGERFRSMARAEERAEQTFELQTKLTNYQINAVARSDKEANELEALSNAASEYRKVNPAATPRDIVDYVVKTVKPSAGALNKYVSQVAQVDESDLKLLNNKIERQIRGQSLSGLIKIFNEDPDYDPNTNIVQEKGPKGEVIIKVVDAKDPRKILESYSFKDETIARDYLIQTAKNPGTQASWLRTMQLQEDQGIYYRARAERYAAGRGTGRDYTNVERNQEIAGLIRYRDSAARDADRLRKDINDMRPNDPNYAQTVARYNAADALVQKLDRDIQDLRSGGGLTRGGGAAPERYEPGKVYSFRDEKGNVKDYRLKEGKTGAAPEDWEEVKAAPAPKAEAEVKTAPAKEEPPKKDTTKYIRDKSPRGTYTYTESPRGLTREQWAQLDEEKKRK